MATKTLNDAEVDKVRQWLFGNIDLKGHRVQNAGNSINNGDYITKGEAKKLNNINIAQSGWTPTGNAVVIVVNSSNVYKIEGLVTVQASVTWPATADASPARILNLPYSVSDYFGIAIGFCNDAGSLKLYLRTNPAGYLEFSLAGGAGVTNAALSGATVQFAGTYF